MLSHLTLVIGGAASGKSAFAEHLVIATNRPRIYLATAQVFDIEMKDKVDRHRDQRGADWDTVEAAFDLAPVLCGAGADQIVLIDCATMWLTNHMLADNDLEAAQTALVHTLADCAAPVVIVTNELGLSVVPENALARRFRDAQGRLNQRLAAEADLVVNVIAGLPQVLKGTLP